MDRREGVRTKTRGWFLSEPDVIPYMLLYGRILYSMVERNKPLCIKCLRIFTIFLILATYLLDQALVLLAIADDSGFH